MPAMHESSVEPDTDADADLRQRERQRILEKIGRYRQVCGCASGALFMTAALLIATAMAVFLDWRHHGWIGFTISALLFVFLSGAIGKMAGLGVARLRIRWLRRSLELKHGE